MSPITNRIACLLSVATLLISVTSMAEDGKAGRSVIAERYSGKHSCTNLFNGTDCGTADWIMTIQTDGTKTLRVFNENNKAGSQNNMFLRVDDNFRPLEGFSNVYFSGKLYGSAFFSIVGNSLTATAKDGETVTQHSLSIPEKFTLLLHPAAADGWHYAHQYDHEKGGVQVGTVCALGGANNSIMCGLREVALEFIGKEKITVGAGTFEADHYRFGEQTEIWTTGEHKFVLRHDYKKFGTSYRLEKLVTENY